MKKMPLHGNAKYPWRRWMNGAIHEAVRGRDFTVTPEVFRTNLLGHAYRHGVKVTTRVKGDVVTFQFDTPRGDA